MMSDLISRQAAIEAVNETIAQYIPYLTRETNGIPLEVALAIKCLPSAQPEIVRCKDCKHRPTKPDDYNPITTDGFALEFPDEKCPCQCEDGWYSKYPDDDWYCPIGERREE